MSPELLRARKERLSRTLAPLMILPLFGAALMVSSACPSLNEARYDASIGVVIGPERMGLDLKS